MPHGNPDQVIYGHGDKTVREWANDGSGKHMEALESQVLTHAAVGTDKILFEATLFSVFEQLHAHLLLEAAAAADAGDTLDIYIDGSWDEGATWYNVIHFTQLLGNVTAPKAYLAVSHTGLAAVYQDVSADLAAAAAPRHFVADRVRVRATTADADANASWTVSLFIAVH